MKIFSKQTPFKKNIVANLFGICVQLINQIVLIPFYLKFWDKDLYSDWIVISAISSFFTITDIGLNNVTANQFTIDYAAKKIEKCVSLLTNNYIIIFIVAFVSLIGCLIYVSFFDIVSNLGLHQLNNGEASYIFVVLLVNIFVGMWTTVINSIFRANSKNHVVVSFDNFGRLIEALIILGAVIFKLKLTVMVTIFLIPKFLIYFIKLHQSKNYFKFSLKLNYADVKLLKSTFSPSLTFMGFPIGNAIIYQGFTLLVNKYFGSASVITYNTTRAMCNFMKQLLVTVQHAIWPEYSIAFGNSDITRMQLLHRKVFKFSNGMGILISIFILIFGPKIFEIWTQRLVVFDWSIMVSFLLVINTENIWTSSSVCLLATNKHGKLGLLYVLFSVISLSVSFLMGFKHLDISLIILSLLIIHVPLTIYALRSSWELTQDNFNDFVKSILTFK